MLIGVCPLHLHNVNAGRSETKNGHGPGSILSPIDGELPDSGGGGYMDGSDFVCIRPDGGSISSPWGVIDGRRARLFSSADARELGRAIVVLE